MIFKTRDLCNNSFDGDIFFSKNKARPSKSLVSTELYTKFKNINTIFNQCFFIESSLDEFILTEILNYYYRHKIEQFKIINNKIETETGIIHFLINNKSILYLLKNITELEIKENDHLLVNIEHLYSYPNLEVIILICYLYEKCYIYNSKFSSNIYILYCNYKRDDKIKIVIDNVLKSWNEKLNLRLIGLNIPTDVQIDVFKFNNSLFNNKISNNELLLANMSIEKNNMINNEKKLLYNYYTKYLKLLTFEICENNSCIIRECIFMNCKICINCYSLFY